MHRTVTFVLGLAVALWIAYTVYVVARFGGAVVLDTDTTSRIMAVRNGNEMHSAAGLTYHGASGAALVIAELAIVIAGAVMAFFGTGWRRALGLAVLLMWTAVWLGNALWLQSHGWDHARWPLAVAMLVTFLWAGLRLTGSTRHDTARAS